MAKKYTVKKDTGEILKSGLDVKEAAEFMLTHDGRQFKIVAEAVGFGTDHIVNKLSVSQRSVNSYGGAGKLLEWIDYSGKSQDEVFENIVKFGGDNTIAELELSRARTDRYGEVQELILRIANIEQLDFLSEIVGEMFQEEENHALAKSYRYVAEILALAVKYKNVRI